MRRSTEKYVEVREEIRTFEPGVYTTRSFDAFVPAPLPPNPPLNNDHELLARADAAIGQLKTISGMLPDVSHLLYAFVRREAVFSSQIEGTISSLVDLLLYECKQATGVTFEDVHETSGCVSAIELGLRILRDGKPVTSDLIREVHAILLGEGRGNDKSPGKFRRQQVWVGSIFIPPPASFVPECMNELERFFGDSSIPPLIKAGLAHVQFETIHPFLDGNGRVGRLLIILMLIADGKLNAPNFYPSIYFMQHRLEYYDRLGFVRTHGDWEGWIRYYLQGVIEAATDAWQMAERILSLFESDLKAVHGLGRSADATIAVYESLKKKPIMDVQEILDSTKLAPPAVAQALERLAELKIVREITDKKRNRVFAYESYVVILDDGTVVPKRMNLMSKTTSDYSE